MQDLIEYYSNPVFINLPLEIQMITFNQTNWAIGLYKTKD